MTTQQSQPLADTTSSTETATTRGRAASLLGVTSRTMWDWSREPGFPGRMGSPGRADGHFPIAEIEAWRKQRFGDPADTAASRSTRERMIGARADILELERNKLLGDLIEVETVERLFLRVASGARSVLGQLPDRLCSGAPDEDRPRLRRLAHSLVDETFVAMGRLIEPPAAPQPDQAGDATKGDSAHPQTQPAARDRMNDARADILEIERDRLRANLISTEEVARLQRIVARDSRRVLGQIPDRLCTLADLEPDAAILKPRLRRIGERVRADVLAAMSELLDPRDKDASQPAEHDETTEGDAEHSEPQQAAVSDARALRGASHPIAVDSDKNVTNCGQGLPKVPSESKIVSSAGDCESTADQNVAYQQSEGE